MRGNELEGLSAHQGSDARKDWGRLIRAASLHHWVTLVAPPRVTRGLGPDRSSPAAGLRQSLLQCRTAPTWPRG